MLCIGTEDGLLTAIDLIINDLQATLLTDFVLYLYSTNKITILMQNRQLHISGLLAILLTTTMVHTQQQVL